MAPQTSLMAVVYILLLLGCMLLCPFACWAAFKRFMNRAFACILAGSGVPVGYFLSFLAMEEIHYEYEWLIVIPLVYFPSVLFSAVLYGVTARGFDRQL